MIYLNARFSRTDPLWIAPPVAHEVTYLEADASTADGAVEACRVEHEVCERVLSGQRWSRACEDAAALLALDNPRAALREAGFR